MAQKRAHFFLPEELLAAMDKLGGKGKRNSLAVEILQSEVKRRRLMQILSNDTPIWRDEDHPELKDGAGAWVRQMRQADDKQRRDKLGDWLGPRE